MKKLLVVLFVCFLLVGCTNPFAKKEENVTPSNTTQTQTEPEKKDTRSVMSCSTETEASGITFLTEMTFYFEWYGENSFAGRHQEGDEMHLALTDVFIKKKGYIEPREYERMFRNSGVEVPELIYQGVLNADIINSIMDNDWTEDCCGWPTVKEGVVFKRSTLLPGQRRPSVKVKTRWWLNKLHSMYSEEECKILE